MCGIVGFWRSDDKDVAEQLNLGLWALQHRGKEAAGIATWNPRRERIYREVGAGEVAQAISKKKLGHLRGPVGVAQNRYSTSGASTLENAQPILGTFRGKPFALVHNGNLVNKHELRKECILAGFEFSNTSDTGVMAASIELSSASTMGSALVRVAKTWRGAFSIIVLYDGELFALRDPWGVRPLHVGVAWPTVVIASESCVAAHMRIKKANTFDVPPGGFVEMRRDGTLVQWRWAEEEKVQARCLFEYVYFARPDSSLDGVRASLVRKRSGELLAEEAPADVDIVVPVLDSGRHAAQGYARKIGLPLEEALFRSNMVSRTFIENMQKLREEGVLFKFTAISEELEGKRIVVVDDSLVRNTTAKTVIGLLREGGAKEVHWRNASPPVRFGCYYGIDTYREIPLLAMRRHNDDIEAIRQECGADSLAYLSQEGLLRAIQEVSGGKLNEQLLCTGCWTGEYRIAGTPSAEEQVRLCAVR